eukprot:1150007-Pelagomonas_calceolata.AAC.3
MDSAHSDACHNTGSGARVWGSAFHINTVHLISHLPYLLFASARFTAQRCYPGRAPCKSIHLSAQTSQSTLSALPLSNPPPTEYVLPASHPSHTVTILTHPLTIGAVAVVAAVPRTAAPPSSDPHLSETRLPEWEPGLQWWCALALGLALAL